MFFDLDLNVAFAVYAIRFKKTEHKYENMNEWRYCETCGKDRAAILWCPCTRYKYTRSLNSYVILPDGLIYNNKDAKRYKERAQSVSINQNIRGNIHMFHDDLVVFTVPSKSDLRISKYKPILSSDDEN